MEVNQRSEFQSSLVAAVCSYHILEPSLMTINSEMERRIVVLLREKMPLTNKTAPRHRAWNRVVLRLEPDSSDVQKSSREREPAKMIAKN